MFDINSDQPGSVPIGPDHPSDYHNPDQHNMECNSACETPSSTSSPTSPAYQFPNCMEDDLPEFNDPGSGLRSALTGHGLESPLNTEDTDYKKNTEAMRNTWMADYSRFIDGHKVSKIFSKHAKAKIPAWQTNPTIAASRMHPARFKCSIQGCNADFTRKHNLENHLKSHCGVTDRVCSLCGKGFTTIPVWKRHQKSCERAASSSMTATPKNFLDAMTPQLPG